MATLLGDWSPQQPNYSAEALSLLFTTETEPTRHVKLEEIIANSESFPIKFPIDTGRCKRLKNLTSLDILEHHINSVYPVVHENVLHLFAEFILYKRTHGTEIEKNFYKDMTLKKFVNRLLRNRAVSFVGRNDIHKLYDGRIESGNWKTIGTNNEVPPLLLKDYLSYDEIKLSAFLSVSSYTYFVNIGDRYNEGVYNKDRENIEDQGVIIGLIGPRLEKEFVMDFQDFVINREQNIELGGYGPKSQDSLPSFFAKFFEEPYFKTYKEFAECEPDGIRYVYVRNNNIFDNYVYSKRLTFSFDTLLLEANQRAHDVSKTAYIHLVGLGLGVWRMSLHQEKIYADTLHDRIKSLGGRLNAINDICLSYIKVSDCGGVKNGEIIPIDGHPQLGIRIHILKREPHKKLIEQGMLLIVSYAWDGNALPGNEFWMGNLDGSGDSAAAASTQIAEIHNPHINPLVSMDKLKVVCEKGVVPFEVYQAAIKEKFT